MNSVVPELAIIKSMYTILYEYSGSRPTGRVKDHHGLLSLTMPNVNIIPV